MTTIPDLTEHAEPVTVGFQDPAEPILSDLETEPIHRDPRPISARYDKWRLYSRPAANGTVLWYAYQPDQIDAPMFPSPDTFGGSYGVWTRSGSKALAMLQLAMARAAA